MGGGTDRVTRWTQKLLDLSLRNRLLNARDGKQILPLRVDSLGSLEDRLAADQAVALDSLSDLPSDELARRLKELYRLAKVELEESGVNALYLALGFLKWRTEGANAKDCRAPLLLLPVGLSRQSVNQGYRMARLDEDAALNATLVEFLRTALI